MSEITVLGIDLAKRSFQLHGLDSKGNAVLKKAMNPQKADQYIAQLKPCLIGMEACGGANYRAHKYQAMGHTVKIIAPQFVKPFVQGNRNDISDAAGIAEAVSRPSIRCVPIRSAESQTLRNYHRIRERLMSNRIALSNEIRGIMYEYNWVIAKSDKALKAALQVIVEDYSLSSILRSQMAELYQEFIEIQGRIDAIDAKLQALAKSSEDCQRLMQIPGVGPLIATAIYASVGNVSEFKNGRQLAAWLGLVPGHRQTGGPSGSKIMLPITKRGDRYLRQLIVQGARCLLISANKRDDRVSQWACKLKESKGFNKAAVALANKTARIIWAILARHESYVSAKAASAAAS